MRICTFALVVMTACSASTSEPSTREPTPADDPMPAAPSPTAPIEEPTPAAVCSTPDRWHHATGYTVYDGTTGLLWRAPIHAYDPATACAPSRNPTTAELLHLVMDAGVCRPTIDSFAFGSDRVTDVYATDGCVSMLTGLAKPSCGREAYVMCVVPHP